MHVSNKVGHIQVLITKRMCVVCECVSVLHLASTSCQLICLFAWRTRPRGRDELEGLMGPKSNERNEQENYRTD